MGMKIVAVALALFSGCVTVGGKRIEQVVFHNVEFKQDFVYACYQDRLSEPNTLDCVDMTEYESILTTIDTELE